MWGRSSGHKIPQLFFFFFFCLGKSSSLLHFWRKALLCRAFVGSFLPFSILSISSYFLLASKGSVEKFMLWSFSYTLQASFSLWLLLRFSGFDFDSFILMCLRGDLFKLILFGDIGVSWTWISESLPRFGKLSTIISLNKFSAFFCLSSPSGTPITHKMILLMAPSIAHIDFLHSSLFLFLCSSFTG